MAVCINFSGSDSNSADLSLVKQEFGEGEDEGVSRFYKLLQRKNLKTEQEFAEAKNEGMFRIIYSFQH